MNRPGIDSYDVKKTDSLVSPFMAVLNVTFSNVVFTSPDEATTRNADLPGQATATSSHVSKITFAMQDGVWVPKSWTERGRLKHADSSSFEEGVEIKIPFTEKEKISGPKRHCIP